MRDLLTNLPEGGAGGEGEHKGQEGRGDRGGRGGQGARGARGDRGARGAMHSAHIHLGGSVQITQSHLCCRQPWSFWSVGRVSMSWPDLNLFTLGAALHQESWCCIA